MWTVRDPHKDWPVIDEIEKTNDRVTAIVGAALVEDRLETAIKVLLHEHDKLTPRMFSGTGPLASFATQANLGFLLGIYRENIWANLSRMARIRNVFAHELEVNTFDHDQVKDLMNNLDVVENLSDCPSRWRQVIIDKFQPAASPRQRFIDTAKVLLFFLEMYKTDSVPDVGPRQPSF
jgi:hypothetical protein